MLQIHVRGKGRSDFNQSELGFSEPEKLNKGEGWKINLPYGTDKIWSISLPPFDTKCIAKKDNRYYVRTKYRRIINLINQLVDPVAKYLHEHRTELGITKSLSELQTTLTRDIFVGRTLHTNVFYDREQLPVELDQLNPGISVKVSVKPVLYVRKNEDPYIDFEITRAIVASITKQIKKQEQDEKIVKSTGLKFRAKTSEVATSSK